MLIEKKTVLGVYSDSGLNAVELALLETDGIDVYHQPVCMSRPYPIDLKDKIFRFILKGDYTQTYEMKEIDSFLTDFHISVIREFYEEHKRKYPDIDAIGYSGHVVYHKPKDKISISLGSSDKIAKEFNTPVVSRFIQSDLKSGGQGGPLFASYYTALTQKFKKPIGIVSLGGITTLTCIGEFGEMQAFDIGIGTRLLDYWIYKHTGSEMDFDGLYASKGTVDKRLLSRLLNEKFYLQHPPKTVDKNEFIDMYEQVLGCSLPNGAATLTALIAHSIKKAQTFLSVQPQEWILIGGGIYNPVLVRMIKSILTEPVRTGVECGFQNTTLNAQSYAFLSVRSLMKLPISFPHTTGVSEPTTGGKIFYP